MRIHLTDNLPLRPSDAVAAIIVLDDGRYLLQLRDDKPGIFFPAHWGLVGGALDDGEAEDEALRREVQEELGVTVGTYRHLMRFEFDLDSMGIGKFTRSFFEVPLTRDAFKSIRLSEGQSVSALSREEALQVHPMAPYDAFALWWHANQGRVKQP